MTDTTINTLTGVWAKIAGVPDGTAYADCGHDGPRGTGISMVSANRDGEEGDHAHVCRVLSIDPVAFPAVTLCEACTDSLPSWVARRAETERMAKGRKVKTAAAIATKLEDLRAEGGTIYQCPDCDEYMGDEEVAPVRYCTHCEQSFDASGGSNCTECNRPFTRKLGPGCPNCADGYGEDEPELQEVD